MQTQLIGPTGHPMIAFGGEHSYKQFVKGDVVCSLQWINDDPSMCLWKLSESMLHRGAYVIGLSALHKYVESNGFPTRYMLAKLPEIAQQIGFEVSKDSCMRIADVIADAAEDLCRMPPTPGDVHEANRPESVGEMQIKLGGKIIHEAEV